MAILPLPAASSPGTSAFMFILSQGETRAHGAGPEPRTLPFLPLPSALLTPAPTARVGSSSSSTHKKASQASEDATITGQVETVTPSVLRGNRVLAGRRRSRQPHNVPSSFPEASHWMEEGRDTSSTLRGGVARTGDSGAGRARGSEFCPGILGPRGGPGEAGSVGLLEAKALGGTMRGEGRRRLHPARLRGRGPQAPALVHSRHPSLGS